MRKKGANPLRKGDIVHLDYEAWIVEKNELFDTTKEEIAKKHEIFDEKTTYKPIPIIVGANKVVKGLDEHLLKAQVDKKYTVEINPKDGFGERDPKLVELHSKREIMRLPEFRKGDKEPYVGMKIIMNNRIGWITAVTAGRIRVDFNNRFAGHKLKYIYKIMDYAKTQEKKVKSILEMHYNKVEDFEIKQIKSDVVIKLPDACKYDLGWFQSKYRVVSDLREYANVNTVQFIEEYIKKVDTSKETGKDKEKKEDKKTKDSTEKGKNVEKNKEDLKVEETKKDKSNKDEKK